MIFCLGAGNLYFLVPIQFVHSLETIRAWCVCVHNETHLFLLRETNTVGLIESGQIGTQYDNRALFMSLIWVHFWWLFEAIKPIAHS